MDGVGEERVDIKRSVATLIHRSKNCLARAAGGRSVGMSVAAASRASVIFLYSFWVEYYSCSVYFGDFDRFVNVSVCGEEAVIEAV